MESIPNIDNFNPKNWISEFKHSIFKTTIINLPFRFLQYLNEDGIFIHDKYVIQETKGKNPDCEWIFPEFDEKIIETLENYEGKIFIKLNWKAPIDGEGWVPMLKCQNIEEIFLLLKSSARIGEMLDNFFSKVFDENSLKECGGLDLIIKKWYNLNKGMEFRCFVKDQKVIAISQRNINHFYPFLLESKFQDFIIVKINEFYENIIKLKFKENKFCFDVYIDIPPKYKIILVDINLWGNFSNSLLFEWDELEEIEIKEKNSIFKAVLTEKEVILDSKTSYKMPFEFSGDINSESINNVFSILNSEDPELYQN